MFSKKAVLFILSVLISALVIGACAPPVSPNSPSAPVPQATGLVTLRIVADDAIRAMEDKGILADFTKTSGIGLSIEYKGSIDIKNQVLAIAKNNPRTVDAFWPASSIWLPGSTVQNQQSVARTYVVLAVNPTTAKSLGWDTTRGISVQDLVTAIKNGKVSLAMPSATQTDLGAMFYLAFVSTLKGTPGVTLHDDLSKPEVVEGSKTILSAVKRGAESAATLKNVFVDDQLSVAPKYNAAVLYENLAIEANQALSAKGKEPLRIFYVKGATALADAPLGFVDNGDPAKKEAFDKLVEFLQSEPVQRKILTTGWRNATIGMRVQGADPAIFNPAWGVNVTTEFPAVVLPKDAVIAEALDLYQTAYRNPSYTAFCLDISGSMAGNGGIVKVKEAMDTLLDQTKAAQNGLGATKNDQYVVYAFNNGVRRVGAVNGNDPTALKSLSGQVASLQADGGTAMYDCVVTALEDIRKSYDPSQLNYAVIAMTDGQTNSGRNSANFEQYYKDLVNKNQHIPTFAIGFGSADENQLKLLAKITSGEFFDGSKDLILAFRKARGSQ